MGLLKGQVALVTGASRGIGQAILLELARQGANVVGTATTEQGVRAIAEDLKTADLRGSSHILNVNNSEQVAEIIENVTQKVGAISILVNNAGITNDNLALRMKEEEWDNVINTNLKSVFKLSQSVLKSMMKARHGRIINISSVVGVMGNPGQGNYAAAKAAVIGFSKSLAREVGSRNITVNCVAPGFIDTDMTRALSDVQRQALLDHIPLGRLGTVEDIAAVTAFLAGPNAAYITGATIHVNGGMYMD